MQQQFGKLKSRLQEIYQIPSRIVYQKLKYVKDEYESQKAERLIKALMPSIFDSQSQ